MTDDDNRRPDAARGARPPVDPTAEAVRASLQAQARRAPTGDMLAERIIHAADRSAARPAGAAGRRPWRTWTLPVVAAGSVAAVVGIVIGIQNYHPGRPSSPPVAEAHHTPSGSQSVGSGPARTSPSTSAPVGQRGPTSVSTPLRDVKIQDLTFSSADDGWALASARCATNAGTCTALFRTTDGSSWHSVAGAQFNVAGVSGGCNYPCVEHLRFADADTGYAYGPSALLMTRDGGRSWSRLSGGALALETFDGNVIRVTSAGTGCPSYCDVQVEVAAIGSSTFAPADLGRPPTDATYAAPTLARGGSNAYLLFQGHPTGGASTATSTLYRSGDDGRHWSAVGDPCSQPGGEVDSYTVAAGAAGRVSALCGSRQSPQRFFVATSTDAGRTFQSTPGRIPTADATLLTGDPSTVLVAGGAALVRSNDGGASWHPVAGPGAGIDFVGFESSTLGRAVAQHGTAIWTTRDGGRTWTSVVPS